MHITDKQVAAVEFIAHNPGSTVEEITRAAGTSTSPQNAADFLRRLIDSGLVQLTVTSDVEAMLDGDYLPEPVAPLAAAFRDAWRRRDTCEKP